MILVHGFNSHPPFQKVRTAKKISSLGDLCFDALRICSGSSAVEWELKIPVMQVRLLPTVNIKS